MIFTKLLFFFFKEEHLLRLLSKKRWGNHERECAYREFHYEVQELFHENSELSNASIKHPSEYIFISLKDLQTFQRLLLNDQIQLTQLTPCLEIIITIN